MLNTMLSTEYKVINKTELFIILCSPRGPQNLVGTKQTRDEEKREKLNNPCCPSG